MSPLEWKILLCDCNGEILIVILDYIARLSLHYLLFIMPRHRFSRAEAIIDVLVSSVEKKVDLVVLAE